MCWMASLMFSTAGAVVQCRSNKSQGNVTAGICILGQSIQWNLIITEVLGTMKNYLVISGFSLYQVKKTKKYKEWDQQNYLVIRGFCYIRPLYNEVPLYYQVKGKLQTIL